MSERSLIEAVGPFLSRFARKGDKYNFRCVYCGDSSKDESKTRAWLLPPRSNHKIDTYVYHCFNCNKSTTLEKFLKDNFSEQYDKLLLDKYVGKENRVSKSKKVVGLSEPLQFNDRLIEDLSRVSLLPEDHPCVQYCLDRRIPKIVWSDLWYAERYEPWIQTILPERKNYKKISKRLVFPLRTRSGNLFGVQGRALDFDRIRYKTFIFVEGRPQVYGLERVNFNRKFYVLEGTVDSLFVENSIAVGSSNLVAGLKSLRTVEENAVLIFDNQPKNLEITESLRSAISSGFAVCIWPQSLRQKDINDMIRSGMTEEDLMNIIQANTFKGLSAETMLIERKFIRGKDFDRGTKRESFSR